MPVQLTGPIADTARYYRDAYQLVVDNESGGINVGNETYTLALKLYDNQSDVNLSVRQYTQLVSRDKVNFLLGPFASSFVLADSAVSEKYQIPMVQGGPGRRRVGRDFFAQVQVHFRDPRAGQPLFRDDGGNDEAA